MESDLSDILESKILEMLLYHSSTDGIVVYDREFRLVYWSPAMEKITGFCKSDSIGNTLFDMLPFLKETGDDQHCYQALGGKSISTMHSQYRIPSTGRVGFFNGQYSPLFNKGGQITGGIFYFRDTTEQRMAEERIRESEARFRVMADGAPVALWMARKDGLCDFFNQGWLRFTGRTMEQEFGVGWAESVHAEDFQRCMDTYLDAFNSRTPFTMEYRMRRYDGTYRWILDNGVPRYSPDGTFMGFIGSCIDITDQKNAMDELARIVVELREALHVRDDFISIASHELRTPLTPLKMQLQGLNRHLQSLSTSIPKSDLVLRAIEISRGQVDRLSMLVENLLDVSRIRSGQITLNREEVDLNQVMKDVLERFQPEIKKSKCTIELFFAPKSVGMWDRLRIEQLLINLLTNGMKYGAGKLIQIYLENYENYLRLRIRDHGIGIAKEDQKRIFSRFERAASIKNYPGLGLGLYIAKQIVDAHRGSIRVESEPNQGAAFIVELPLSERQEVA